MNADPRDNIQESRPADNGDANPNRVDFADLTTEAKIKRNNERLVLFQRQGVAVDAANMRIGTMLEFLLGDQLPEAEDLIQDRLDAALNQIEQQQQQAQILQPGAGPVGDLPKAG